mmetsp:Transcript_41019/g.103948  ORF Transcript_41019/g.103948 Transcript_41019/m.103948 type:complete len:315 (-) Transcript_41019:2653-3597(-)
MYARIWMVDVIALVCTDDHYCGSGEQRAVSWCPCGRWQAHTPDRPERTALSSSSTRPCNACRCALYLRTKSSISIAFFSRSFDISSSAFFVNSSSCRVFTSSSLSLLTECIPSMISAANCLAASWLGMASPPSPGGLDSSSRSSCSSAFILFTVSRVAAVCSSKAAILACAASSSWFIRSSVSAVWCVSPLATSGPVGTEDWIPSPAATASALLQNRVSRSWRPVRSSDQAPLLAVPRFRSLALITPLLNLRISSLRQIVQACFQPLMHLVLAADELQVALYIVLRNALRRTVNGISASEFVTSIAAPETSIAD